MFFSERPSPSGPPDYQVVDMININIHAQYKQAVYEDRSLLQEHIHIVAQIHFLLLGRYLL